MKKSPTLALAKLTIYKDNGHVNFLVLNYGVYKNMLRIYVKESNGKGERNANIVNTAIPFINARLLGDELSKLDSQKEGYVFSMKLYGPKWDNSTNKRVEGEKELNATIGLGKVKDKDENIINIMFVVSQHGVKKVFPLTTTPYTELFRDGKQITDKAELSNIWARAYAKSFNDALGDMPEAYSQPETSAPANNYNKQSVVTDKDIIDDL